METISQLLIWASLKNTYPITITQTKSIVVKVAFGNVVATSQYFSAFLELVVVKNVVFTNLKPHQVMFY